MSRGKAVGRHKEKALTAVAVKALRAPGFYADGNGLHLKVEASGAKRWVQRLVIQGKRRDLGLGSATTVTLAQARDTALENRKTARSGGDPNAVRLRAAAIPTFQTAAQKVHDLHLPTWRNAKHGQQWLSTLREHVFPYFGTKRVDAVTSADVLGALSKIWNSHPETARRVRQRIGTVFKWARAQGWRLDNPASTISEDLPKHDRAQIQHRTALPYNDVANAVVRVRESGALPSTKLEIEFAILTATRSAETREAVWSEIDSVKAEWVIPAARMKAKRAHRVPLARRCLAILQEAQALADGETRLVFPGSVAGRPLSDATLSKLLRELRIAAVPHGFRSSFRDWAGEQTSFPREVCEFALAHSIKHKAEASYARSDLFNKRRELMDAWCLYLSN